jgi:hypothetical protein
MTPTSNGPVSDYIAGMTANRDRCAPPAIAPVLDLVLPLEPPVEFGSDTEDTPVPPGWAVPCGLLVEVVLEMETTDGAEGVASGSLPAARARTTSNALSYTVC